MSEEGGERTEQASERQIEKFRQEGKVATSRELSAALGLGGGVLGLLVGLPWLGESVISVARGAVARAAHPHISLTDVGPTTVSLIVALAPGVAAILLPGAVLSLGVGLVVTNFNVTTEALGPKLEHLDPIGGFAKLFSPQSLEGLAKALLVFGLVGWAGWSALSPHWDSLPAAAGWPAAAQARFLADVVQSLLVRSTVAAVALGAADFGWQKWRMNQQMMMSKQQVKEEHKESEGDPHVRAARRRRARQLATGRMLRDVTKADVIVTNPTHYAVALRYRKNENAAPVVLARGVDHMALQIRSVAAKNDVPILENRPLARALYARAKVGQAIPPDLYGPVAQVLATVYRRRRATNGGHKPTQSP